MNLTIKTTGVTVGEDTRQYLDQKLISLGKYLDVSDTTLQAAVEFGMEAGKHRTGDNLFRAEITLSASAKVFRAEGGGSTLHTAIDVMAERLGKELRRAKNKETSLMRRTGAAMKDAVRGFRPWPFRRR